MNMREGDKRLTQRKQEVKLEILSERSLVDIPADVLHLLEFYSLQM